MHQDSIKTDLVSARKYWRSALNDAKTSLLLPGNYNRTNCYTQERYSFQLDRVLNNSLLVRSKNNSLLEYVTFLSGLKILFYKLTGITQIVISSPAYLDSKINKFIIFSNNMKGDMTFRDVMQDVGKTVKLGYEYQYFPLEEAIDLGQYSCIRENMTRYFLSYEEIHHKSELNNLITSNSNEITIVLRKEDISFTGQAIYNSAIYKPVMIESYMKAYMSILHQMVESLDIKMKDFSLYQNKKTASCIVKKSGDRTIIDLFEKTVSLYEDRTALIEGTTIITYGDLNKKANQLSNKLIHLGVGNGKTICIMTDNTIEAVIGIVSALKVGAVFVLLNPELPNDIKDTILRDSNADLLLVSIVKDEIYQIPAVFIMQEMLQDTFHSSREVQMEDLSCISYSINEEAGLLGTLIKHNQLINNWKSFHEDLGLCQEQRIAMSVSVMPTASLWVIYLTLLHHLQLYIIPEDMLNNNELLISYIEKHEINVMLCPAMYAQQMKESNSSHLEKIIVPGGEDTAVYDFSSNKIETVVLYGPIEYFPYVGIYDNKEFARNETWKSISQGMNCSNLLILDADGMFVPEGVPGDLYITGNGIALGYKNNQVYTNQKYGKHPIDNRKLVFKTETKARINENGLLQVYHEFGLQNSTLGEADNIIQQNRAASSAVREVEHQVTELFKDILNLEQIGRDMRFLDAGGNSISLMKLVAELNKIYPDAVKVSDVFTYSTPAALASFIVRKLTSDKEEKNTGLESIQHMAVPFPQEYFMTDNSKSNQTTLMYEFDAELSEHLLLAAKKLNISLFSIVYSVFIYVLSGLSKQKRLQVQYIIDDKENVGFVDVNFELMEDIGKYFIDVDAGIKKNDIIYNLNNINKINDNVHTDKIIPLFYDMKVYHFSQKILSIYEIILGLRVSSEKDIHLIYRYNGIRINGDKAKELFYMIISYIKEIVNLLFQK